MVEIRKAVYQVTKRRPKTISQAIAELKNYLKDLGQEDLCPADNDLESLIELCGIYSDTPLSELMTEELLNDIELETIPLYKRVGKIIKPYVNDRAKTKILATAEAIIQFNPDLTYELEEKGLVFLAGDLTRAFRFENIRAIDGMPTEFSGVIQLTKVRTLKEAEKLVPKDYWIKKKWSETTYGVTGKYFTTTELLNLIANRKLITNGDYE